MHLDVVALTIGLLAVLGGIGLVASVHALRDDSDVLRRLRGGPAAPDRAAVADRASELGRHLGPLARLTGAGDEEVSRLRRQLVWAGHRGEYAVQAFLASKVVLGLGALVAFAFVSTGRAEPLPHAVATAILAVGAGFFLPNLWLRARIGERQGAVSRALPDALDLLVTCVEAGLGLDAAFQRVASELAPAWPVLAEELSLTSLEVKAGIPRTDAMRRLADRTGVADLRSLSATLNQTEMFGTSVADALRIQAEGMRVRRSQRAEERAAYLSVKMTLPLALCIFPCLFAVVLGPAAVNIMNAILR